MGQRRAPCRWEYGTARFACGPTQGSHSVPRLGAPTTVFLKQTSDPVPLPFKSLHSRPRIKPKVLSLGFMAWHNQACSSFPGISLTKDELLMPPINPFYLLFLAYSVPPARNLPLTIFLQSQHSITPPPQDTFTLKTLIQAADPSFICYLLSEVFQPPLRISHLKFQSPTSIRNSSFIHQ